jgi:multidrug efflux pump subunit AcrA (membrane-fusion protein)
METPRHPYRKFVFAAATRTAAGHYSVTSPRHGRAFRLEPAEFELARLFDGDRDPAELREAATRLFGREFTAAELEQFANELALAGLLQAGTQQPLPVPPQSDEEAAAEGWLGQRATPGPEIAPPSTVPGSLSGSGRMGTLTSLWGTFRGQADAFRFSIPVKPFLPLGSLLGWALYSSVLVWLLVAAAFGSAFALWVNRVAVAQDVARLVHPLMFVLTAVVCLGLLEFLGEVARAAAVRRATGVVPRFGILFGVGLIPFFKAETAGPAEAADRPTRMRIIGAALVATFTLQLLAIGGWFAFHHGHNGILPVLCIGLAIAAMIWVFILINPLAKRDGYHLLANLLQAPDLREQALIALFGYRKPWLDTRQLNKSTLYVYAALCVAYLAWVIIWLVIFPGEWLAGGWGGAGVLVFVVAVGYYIWLQVRRILSQRSNIGGEIVVPPPSRIDWLIIGVIVAVALFPYPYQPSGDFTVLPYARADVRALIAGDVRQVLVKEGDTVKAGQVIAQLADDQEQAAVETSKADVARLYAELQLAKQGARPEEIEVARQEVATAQKRYDFSAAEAERQGKAFRQKAVSEQQYQHYLSEAQVDQQQLLEAKRHLDLVTGGTRPEKLDEIRAELASAQAQLNYHQQQLEYTKVRAPIDGKVVSGSLMFAVGDYMERGALLARVDDTDKLQVEIRLPETAIGEVAVGNRACAKAWGVPFACYEGVVTRIAPSAQADADGRVVRVMMQVDRADGQLKPEMTGYAKVNAATYPLIVAFTRPLVRFVLIEVWSWLP